jgi:hypothetical protein
MLNEQKKTRIIFHLTKRKTTILIVPPPLPWCLEVAQFACDVAPALGTVQQKNRTYSPISS